VYLCRIITAFITCSRTWIAPGLGPVGPKRGAATRFLNALESTLNLGNDNEWVIMAESLTRSCLSSFVQTRSLRPCGPGDPSESDESGVVSYSGRLDSSSPTSDNSLDCPKPSPRRLVVGVPVTIHRRSTLSVFRNVESALSADEETCPSSMTSRFQRTEVSGLLEASRSHVQFVIRIRSKSGHLHFPATRSVPPRRNSCVNPTWYQKGFSNARRNSTYVLASLIRSVSNFSLLFYELHETLLRCSLRPAVSAKGF